MADGGRIMFVGMNCLDISTTCSEYPAEDCEYECIDMGWVRGGNASNSSTVCAKLGGNTEYMGNLTLTNELQFFQEGFDELGIKYDACPIVKCQCPKTLVLINAQTGSRTLIYHGGGYPELKAADFKSNVKLIPGKYKWIHFEGRSTVNEIEKMMNFVGEFNQSVSPEDSITISLEIEKVRKLESVQLIKLADWTFISKDFARAKGYSDMESAVEGFQQYSKPGSTIICAWGEMGAAAKVYDGPIVTSTSYPPEKLVNTTAAGDTFNASMILAAIKGRSLQQSITYACQVAGAKCGMKGFEKIEEFRIN